MADIKSISQSRPPFFESSDFKHDQNILEARILAILPNFSQYPFICEAVYELNDIHESYQELYPEFKEAVKSIDLESSENIPTHIGNIVRLGIFEVRRATDSTIEPMDPGFYESASVELSESGYEALYVTEFGKQFISVCITSGFKDVLIDT